MRKKQKRRDTSIHGNRYNKTVWETVVRRMLDHGATYGEIAVMLNTSNSTVTRFVWDLGWASHEKHRHAVRAEILKKRKADGVHPTKIRETSRR